MKKEKVIVPKGIRFISEWTNFSIPDYPCIIDKKIPGCGFTEYCICNSEDVILCSPRKLLLENKENQHCNDVLYVQNELDQDTMTDKDLEKTNRGSTLVPTDLYDSTPEDIRIQVINNLNKQILEYTKLCKINHKPCKILVTYDSFRLVKDALQDNIYDFRIVIDEFQSIFIDSRFKSSTELEFLHYLQDLTKVCFVSATPMIDGYLEQLDEFKELPYYEFDWKTEDSLRILSPDLKVRTCKSINDVAYKIISDYLLGNYEGVSYKDESGNIQTIYSKEAVFYVNSVSNILGIINKCGLLPEQCNILIARTVDNEKKLKKRLGKSWSIGRIPLRGELHKTFTFCTRTVYLGADFYSTNARTFIFSDANINTLSVDISLDLPQILGRQRNNNNPWKNRAEFYYKTTRKEFTKEEFDNYIREKTKKTDELLKSYEEVTNKQTLAEKYKRDTVNSNYKYDYVAINEHSGSVMIPCLNKLVMISEQRGFDIQQIDYKDRFSVFNTLKNQNLVGDSNISLFLDKFNNLETFPKKMKYLCELDLSEDEVEIILEQIPLTYKNYYLSIGPDRCRAKGYDKNDLEKELQLQKFNITDLQREIYMIFKEGNIYLKSDIKDKLKVIYDSLGYTKSPKAIDLEDYFEIKESEIIVSGKRKVGFKIIKRK